MVLVSARSSVAIAVPIPVRNQPTRTFSLNLLTRRTVLGQPHCRNQQIRKDSRGGLCKFSRFHVFEPTRSRFQWWGGDTYLEFHFASRLQPFRHASQSSSVALHIVFAALCSQRPLRCPKSRRICGIAPGEPKCILAVSHPIEYSSCASSLSAEREANSIREQSGASRLTSHRSWKRTNGSGTRKHRPASFGPYTVLEASFLCHADAEGRMALASRAMKAPPDEVIARILGWPKLPSPATRFFKRYPLFVGNDSSRSWRTS